MNLPLDKRIVTKNQMINKKFNRTTCQVISKITPAKEYGQHQDLYLLTKMENRLKRAKKINFRIMTQEKRKIIQTSRFP